MREAAIIAFISFVFIGIIFGSQLSGERFERSKWCDKYTVRTEYQECMNVGAEYETIQSR